MLNIQRSSNGEVVLSLSGRIEVDDVPELERLLSLEAAGTNIALDLRDVTLINRNAVQFLTQCEAKAIKLKYCPGYIREWIEAEKSQRNGQDR